MSMLGQEPTLLKRNLIQTDIQANLYEKYFPEGLSFRNKPKNVTATVDST